MNETPKPKVPMHTEPYQCPFCANVTQVTAPLAHFIARQNGACAQDAFPDATITERETIISQLCPSCQDNIFAPPTS